MMSLRMALALAIPSPRRKRCGNRRVVLRPRSKAEMENELSDGRRRITYARRVVTAPDGHSLLTLPGPGGIVPTPALVQRSCRPLPRGVVPCMAMRNVRLLLL